MKDRPSILFEILKWAAVCVFAGRAYQHLFWDAPYRELFWDPVFMKGLIEGLTSLTWDEYVTHPQGDILFQRIVRGQGVFYLVCAIVAMYIRKLPRWTRWILLLGAVDLVFLALLYLKDKFYHLGQFFEYSLQFGSPVFLYYLIKRPQNLKKLIFWMKFATLLTFTCHGLYALGYYPRPGTFLTMTSNILNLQGDDAISFLFLAGVLDFIAGFGIFLKGKWERAALIYAIFWGFLTTLARIVGNFYPEFPGESLHQWVFQAVYRVPHFLIPLALLVHSYQQMLQVRLPASQPTSPG